MAAVNMDVQPPATRQALRWIQAESCAQRLRDSRDTHASDSVSRLAAAIRSEHSLEHDEDSLAVSAGRILSQFVGSSGDSLLVAPFHARTEGDDCKDEDSPHLGFAEDRPSRHIVVTEEEMEKEMKMAEEEHPSKGDGEDASFDDRPAALPKASDVLAYRSATALLYGWRIVRLI